MKRRLKTGSMGSQMKFNENRDVSKVIQIYMKTRLNSGSTVAQMRQHETRDVSKVTQILRKRFLNPGSRAQMREAQRNNENTCETCIHRGLR